MAYNFNSNTFDAIKEAFSAADIIKVKQTENEFDIFEYYFIRFRQHIRLEAVSESDMSR